MKDDCPLCEYELEVLEHLSKGWPAKQVAAVMGRSLSAMNNDIRDIRITLKTNSTTGSVATALRKGWIE